MKVNILGTEYEIIKVKYDEEEAFERRCISGYCNSITKKIVYCDMSTYKGWENEESDTIEQTEKLVMRHEIVHAFYSESGLEECALTFDGAWARNEEMVDWLAIQIPKIHKAFTEAGCL